MHHQLVITNIAVGNVLLWREWKASPLLVAFVVNEHPGSDHGSLRGRHPQPHDGVGNVGLAMSRTRSI
jgi:hypothetical protein